MLLDHLFVGDRQLTAKNEVGEGILVQDILNPKLVVLHLEINPEFFCPNPVEDAIPAVESTDPRVIIVLEVVIGQHADTLNDAHLMKSIEVIEHIHALIAEIYLKHEKLKLSEEDSTGNANNRECREKRARVTLLCVNLLDPSVPFRESG